jgi:hypothetical protein
VGELSRARPCRPAQKALGAIRCCISATAAPRADCPSYLALHHLILNHRGRHNLQARRRQASHRRHAIMQWRSAVRGCTGRRLHADCVAQRQFWARAASRHAARCLRHSLLPTHADRQTGLSWLCGALCPSDSPHLGRPTSCPRPRCSATISPPPRQWRRPAGTRTGGARCGCRQRQRGRQQGCCGGGEAPAHRWQAVPVAEGRLHGPLPAPACVVLPPRLT